MKRIVSAVSGAVGRALADFPPGASAAAPSLPGASAALVALAIRRLHSGRDLVVVAEGPQECEAVFSDIHAFDPAVEHEPLLLLPPEAGDRRNADQDGMRLAAARALYGGAGDTSGGAADEAADGGQAEGAKGGAAPTGRLFIATPTALLAPLPDPDALQRAGLLARVGAPSPIPFGDYAGRLAAAGYERRPEVTEKETFAVRGGLIDVWPPTSPLPLRIDFFGDDVDAIRSFDPVTQRSQDKVDEAWLPPCALDDLPAEPPVGKIREGSAFIWLEHDRVAASARRPGDEVPTPEAAWALSEAVAARHPVLQLFTGDPPPSGTPTVNLAPQSPPGISDIAGVASDPLLRADARRQLLEGLAARAAAGETVCICIDTAGGIEWLSREIGEGSRILLRQGVLSGGFSWPELRLTVLAQPDIYSTRKLMGRRLVPPSIAGAGERVHRPEELQPGDYVVHIDHGIGRFEGTKQVTVGGKTQEVLSIVYADDVRLQVPVSHAHLLSRYVGVTGKPPALHRIGGRRWKAECVKAEKAVVDYASALLDVQARRNAIPGFAFDPAPAWLDAFEASFPFKETKDQTACIAAVKRDMASSRPMDRLICGDAGYGKTEVAMRAAFIAVMNGKQVAVLAPTTVLAEQHYATFRDRMAAFPVRIEVVSRLRSPRQRAETLEAAAAGSVDILIGTHAIIQPGVAFKDLGLVVVDEEQRFGVDHKERLKRLRATVDVLTLSATPIPRTLYMSMTGARDMSLLQTPPQERLEIETKVARDTDATIRAAVMREVNREGQVFFLHNRVMTIGVMLRRLQALLPEVRIGVAHGQMRPSELAETMRLFEAGDYDLLLSTSIVESGLDIPRANTIIIHRADRFGLAELYQLRGRVGRSSRRGYALLLIPEQGIIDSDARERIKAIQRHGGLSGGLGLALRDLELRGAGNLLGAEQSGHIASIGFGLYCQLLKRTVARLRGEKPPELVDVDLILDFIEISPGAGAPEGDAACLPYAYVDDESLRMGIHRRLAEATEVAEVRALSEELTERFGQQPPEARRLLRLAELRIVAARRGYRRIEVKEGVIRPFDRAGRAIPGPDGRFRRLKGGNVDARLTSLFRAVNG